MTDENLNLQITDNARSAMNLAQTTDPANYFRLFVKGYS